jgi:cell division protease FtsH
VNAHLKTILIWFMVIAAVVIGFQIFNTNSGGQQALDESEFYASVDAGEIKEVQITGDAIGFEIKGKYRNPQIGENGQNYRGFTSYVMKSDGLSDRLREQAIAVKAVKPRDGSLFSMLFLWAPLLLFLGVWIFFMRQMQSGGNRAISFGKSRAKLTSSTGKKITFKDVAGIEEAKEETQEIIEFLSEPQKFQRLGGKIPKGVLLVGPPGTGKTLLARAIAGEANVPFFSISGSDFVEMFVGVGASRVRDLFEQGKKNAPCLIFIDEIDAVGRHRGAGLGGGHDEREQTLNQLLVEMDGFETNDGVILIAATNRPDVLDPALLRPGRFDRQVVVPYPDIRGREEILKVHIRRLPVGPDVNLAVIARGTPGFSGADLANLCNEAALHAARLNRKQVIQTDFEVAKDRVMMGAERKSMIIKDEEKRSTAYHEAGHALVALKSKHTDPLHKVTIIPRGQALGLTMQLPEDDKHTYSRRYLVDRLSVLMGGRIAEELMLDQMNTGAGSDLERITDLARKMVCEWGMSDKLGPLTYGKKDEQIFLGREINQHRDYSEATAEAIDAEVRAIVDDIYNYTTKIIENNREALTRIAEALLERETLTGEEVRAVADGESLPPLDAKGPSIDDAPTPDARAAREGDEPKDEAPGGVMPEPGNQPA